MTEWGNPRVDVGAYLGRVGLGEEWLAEPTAKALRELHRTHVLSLPFENIDVALGRPVNLDPGAIQEKLVTHRRGGVCHEHNLLFAAVLEHAGYAVRRVLTRVHDDGKVLLPRGHSSLLVDVEDETWLCDVGYGSDGILEPVPLSATTVQQGEWVFELDRFHDGWRLRSADRTVLYSVNDVTYRRPDIEVAAYFLLTHPRSPFATSLVVQRVTDEARYALRNLDLAVTHPDGGRVEERITPAALPSVLSGIFGIEIGRAEADEVGAFIERHAAVEIPL